MRIVVNGVEEAAGAGATIASLLTARNLTPDKVAVERNRRLVRTDKYDTPLEDGDQIEIVTFVGGG
jgi:thiamine biosynthesis protein ThiS